MRAAPLGYLFLLLAAGCDDTLFGGNKEGGGGDSGGGGSGDDWCAVQAIFNADCTSCHASGSTTYVDLETDPYNAIVGQPGVQYPDKTLIVPGDPDSSFLYLKTTGAQGSDGSSMPIGSGLSDAQNATIKAWIEAGATEDCGGGTDSGGGSGGTDSGVTEGVHPSGYAAPEVHGLDAKLQVSVEGQSCTDCHGADLNGSGEAVSCDTCHSAYATDWKSDCTFCHGGTDNETGAPPRDIDGTVDESALSFNAHTAHVSDSSVKLAFDCEQCHNKPTDVFSEGHLFVGDTTAAIAEVDFTGGLSADGVYDGGGSCSNMYCHGYAWDDGSGLYGAPSVGDDFDSCDTCHPSVNSSGDEVSVLGGKHQVHMEFDDGGDYLDCADCHRSTSADWEVIEHPENHVNGEVGISLVSMMAWDPTTETCEGECHGEAHEADPVRDWYEPFYGYMAPE